MSRWFTERIRLCLRTRGGKIIVGVSLYACFIVLASRAPELASAILGVGIFGIPVARGLGDRWQRSLLSGRSVALEGHLLVVRSAVGETLGRIDISRPYELRTRVGYGNAVYRIDQDGERVRFTSESAGAPEVVRGVLGLEFPPYMRMPWPV